MEITNLLNSALEKYKYVPMNNGYLSKINTIEILDESQQIIEGNCSIIKYLKKQCKTLQFVSGDIIVHTVMKNSEL